MSTVEESEARRLCKVLRERIVEATAVRLINDFGGMEGALSLMLKDDEETHAYLQQDPDHAVCSAIDSLNLAQELDTGNETTLRLFACASCKRSWWKRVLKKKEVSKCKQCSKKYDPIPRDKEWGIGKFLCECGNEFTGFGEMSFTKSECYKCHTLVPIHHMLPPRRNRQRKTQAPHSCNGVDCIGHHSHHIPGVTSNIVSTFVLV
ncbi:unnamed protein product [Lymnaea stagnalis]|uniref:Uncharacterized protein n=1 Tax=Lymnaea stagnalis TaxID=6523 RepID=A0AAV2H6C6_LYMST